MNDLTDLEKQTNIFFENKYILERVFIHRSYLNEHKAAAAEHNERLEFLGDAVLELIVTEYLYKNFDDPEGILTNLRSSLVKGEMLAKTAEKYNFGEYLLLSKGEEKSGGKNKQLLLANSFEAFIGAIYLEKGYGVAKDFVLKSIIPELDFILQKEAHIDPKSHFQEIVQEKIGITPIYRVLEDSGPDHDKTFIIGAYIGDKMIGKGTGSSKQRGQTMAAKDALEHSSEWIE